MGRKSRCGMGRMGRAAVYIGDDGGGVGVNGTAVSRMKDTPSFSCYGFFLSVLNRRLEVKLIG